MRASFEANPVAIQTSHRAVNSTSNLDSGLTPSTAARITHAARAAVSHINVPAVTKW